MIQNEDSFYLLLESGDNILEESPQVYSFQVENSSFSFSGIASVVSKQWKSVVSSGVYVLTGVAALFFRGYAVIASVGAMTLTGIDVAVSRGIKIVADAVEYVFTGISADIRTYKLATERVTYTISAYTADFFDRNGVWLKDKPINTTWDDKNAVTTIWDDVSETGYVILLENSSTLLIEDGDRLKTEQKLQYDEATSITTIWGETPTITTIWT